MRRASRRIPGLLFVALAGIFLIRAVRGVRAGIARWQGSSLVTFADRGRATEMLRRQAEGFDRFEALWLSGEWEIGVWDELSARANSTSEAGRVLLDAAGCDLEASTLSPSSGWPWTGLSEAYARVERSARSRRVVDLATLGGSPWSHVGHAGRVAVGLLRKAIEREPSTAAHRDDLVNLLHELGILDEALVAIRESARVQPSLVFHSGLDIGALPRAFLEAFVDGSREGLGRTPLFPRGSHFVALGQMERRLGRLKRAEADLRAALREPIDSLTRAEASFHLGLVLLDQARFEEAARCIEDAAREPAFALDRAVSLADIAERQGNLTKALDHLREARRLDAGNVVWRCMEVARVASRLGAHDEAVSALKWAILNAPDNPAPRAALVRAYSAAGDVAAARTAYEELVRVGGETPEILRLRGEFAKGPSADGH
ncbi:MAG: tetratricopeptide repeat protein [Acidobacteriia bacterium]|nr:tetratricopeptide repeat protein [Terriglobia bacterium]